MILNNGTAKRVDKKRKIVMIIVIIPKIEPILNL